MYARVLEVLYVVTMPMEGKNERCFLACGFRRWCVDYRQACFAIDFPCDGFGGGNLSPQRNRCNQRQRWQSLHRFRILVPDQNERQAISGLTSICNPEPPTMRTLLMRLLFFPVG